VEKVRGRATNSNSTSIQKTLKLIEDWNTKVKQYKEPVFKFKVRDKEIGIQTHSESLSHLQIPKVSLPRYKPGAIY
jgi:methylmalonyl-CoA mutase